MGLRMHARTVVVFVLLLIFVFSPALSVSGDTEDTYDEDIIASTHILDDEPVIIFLKWPSDYVNEQKFTNRREEGLEIKGVVPSINVFAGTMRSAVNERINAIIDNKISAAKEAKARTITFEYELYFAEPVVSIIIKSTVATATSKIEVESVNFDNKTGAILGADEAVGKHTVQLADKLLYEMIRHNPQHYNPNFDGLRVNQAYSLTEDDFTLWFDQFLLMPNTEDVTSLTVAFDDISEITISRDDYYIKSEFDLRMVPLKMICEEFGYTVTWNQEETKVTVSLDDKIIIELIPIINNYPSEPRSTRSLEAAPEVFDGLTYVPISFFGQILNLVAYSIDDDENITFVSYQALE